MVKELQSVAVRFPLFQLIIDSPLIHEADIISKIGKNKTEDNTVQQAHMAGREEYMKQVLPLGGFPGFLPKWAYNRYALHAGVKEKRRKNRMDVGLDNNQTSTHWLTLETVM